MTGEARLWYESLAPLDNDWPDLQNKFRWQYSKICNTSKQLFHAWRTFKFDKNADMIDSYVLRMSQVAAMLNYGEMQILENFKKNLPYQVYLTLINVNNLRDAIDLAKRVLMKEKLDRQLTGQSSTPFMRIMLCKAVQSIWLILMCLGVIILHKIECTAIHNCSSSGSLFFASLRWNN